jgi:hypothetical protein
MWRRKYRVRACSSVGANDGARVANRAHETRGSAGDRAKACVRQRGESDPSRAAHGAKLCGPWGACDRPSPSRAHDPSRSRWRDRHGCLGYPCGISFRSSGDRIASSGRSSRRPRVARRVLPLVVSGSVRGSSSRKLWGCGARRTGNLVVRRTPFPSARRCPATRRVDRLSLRHEPSHGWVARIGGRSTRRGRDRSRLVSRSFGSTRG